MGCGSSSGNPDVAPSSDTRPTAPPSSPRKESSSGAEKAGEPPRDAEPGPGPGPGGDAGPKSAIQRPPPMTFEVPIERRRGSGSGSGSANSGANGDLDSAGNIVRLHPPKRLLRLEEQQVQLTHQLLDDRLAEADLRRQKILNQRIQSAHVRKHRRRPVNVDEEWKVTSSEDAEDPKELNTAVT